MRFPTASSKAGKYIAPACELIEFEALTSILTVSGGIDPYTEDGALDL